MSTEPLEVVSTPSSKTLSPKALKTIISSSVTSVSSAEGVPVKEVSEPIADQVLIRKEVLRFVTNLSGSVAAKAAEQGMLK